MLKPLTFPKEPVTLLDIKAYARIDHDEDDEGLITLIQTARHMVETYIARSLIIQKWRYTLSLHTKEKQGLSNNCRYGFWGLDLPRSPFIKLLTSPKLIKGDVENDIEDYKLDPAGRMARIYFNQALCDTDSHIQIDFEAGYGDEPHDVPSPLRQAILITVADLYDRVNSGLSPAVTHMIRPYKVMGLA